MKNKLMPTTYLFVLLVLTVVLHFIYPVKQIIYTPFTIIGILFIISGFAINIWADTMFKKTQTTVKPFEEPSALLTSGPFRISRHPMYLGMLMILIGTSILLGSLITFVFPVLFVVMMEIIFIIFEEKNMIKMFNIKYLAYKKTVRRWI